MSGEDYKKSLESRLQAGAKDPDKAISKEVELFIRLNDAPESASFARDLASVVSRACNEKFASEKEITVDTDLLTKTRAYCAKAIEQIENGKAELPEDESSRRRIHANLYTYSADISLRIAKILPTQKFTNAIRAYREYTKAIELSDPEEDRKTIAYTFGFKGDAAKIMADESYGTQKINWLVAAGQETAECARRTEPIDPRYSKYQHSFAARYKIKAADCMRKEFAKRDKLLEEAIEHLETALNLHQRTDLFRAGLHYDAGKAASLMHRNTGQKHYARKAIIHYEKAVNIFKQNPSPKETLKKEAEMRIEQLTKAIRA